MTKDSGAVKEKRGSKIVKWFRDLRSELKKVVWPTKSQVINNTGIVLFVMVLTGLVLFGIDSGLGYLVKILLNINN